MSAIVQADSSMFVDLANYLMDHPPPKKKLIKSTSWTALSSSLNPIVSSHTTLSLVQIMKTVSNRAEQAINFKIKLVLKRQIKSQKYFLWQ